MLRPGSSPLPEARTGTTDGGWLEVVAGLCTTGLSVAVVIVERGERRSPFAADGLQVHPYFIFRLPQLSSERTPLHVRSYAPR